MKEFVQKHKCLFGVVIIFISFLLINLNVVWFGDDYYYLRYSKMEFAECMKEMWAHYLADNGRFIVHLLEAFFLKYNLIIWQIVNTGILTGITYYTAKIATFKKKERMFSVLMLSFLLFALIDIGITRQSVYWVVGTFNYAYPNLMLLLYWYCLLNIENKKYFIPAIFFGVLSAASVEQCAMMTIGVTFLFILSKFDGFKNIKMVLKGNKKLVSLLFLVILGAVTVILAPSQFNRIGIERESIGLLDSLKLNVKFLMINYTLIKGMGIYYILTSIFTIIFAWNDGNKNRGTIFGILGISCAVLYGVNYWRYLKIGVIMDVFRVINILLLVVITFALFIYLNEKVSNKKIINTLTVALVLFAGSQLMMVFSPVLGYRNMLFGIAMLNLISCKIYAECECGIGHKYPWILFVLIALWINGKTAMGYAANKKVEVENQKIISENSEILRDDNATIDLYKFAKEDYSWSNPYVSAYHENEYKVYYDMKCGINWIEWK